MLVLHFQGDCFHIRFVLFCFVFFSSLFCFILFFFFLRNLLYGYKDKALLVHIVGN